MLAQQKTYWNHPGKQQVDSYKDQLSHISNDTTKMYLCREIGMYYQEIQRDSSLFYFQQSLLFAQNLKLKLWEAEAYSRMGFILMNLGNYPGSLQALLNAKSIAEDTECEKNIWHISVFSKEEDPVVARMTVLGCIHDHLGILYIFTGDMEKRLLNFFESRKIAESINDSTLYSLTSMNLGQAYMNMDKLDSALIFEQQALQYLNESGYSKYTGFIYNLTGEIYLQKVNYTLAKEYFNKSIQTNMEQQNLNFLSASYVSLSNLFLTTDQKDSSLIYAKKGLEVLKDLGSPTRLLNAYNSLSSSYKKLNEIDSAFLYQGLAMALKDNLNNIEKINLFQGIGFDEQLRVQELESEKVQTKNKIRIYSLLAGIVVLFLIAFLLYRNNRNRLKANIVLMQQKKEIEEEKKIAEEALSQLKATQSQLIQSEKMASLGELTAGIAHEIQNPLNFVNNFSEINKELIDELKEELAIGNRQSAEEIANDIKENEEKINHHGKRADAIVKGMLQHSRTSNGVKEPTDINALADEYLRLAYHGLRAKDKSFNADFKTDFDPNLPKINVIPQEIGRVLLNLINNAFYAVDKRAKENNEDYKPLVVVKTRLESSPLGGPGGQGVKISVKDNGPGIPAHIIDKIFQPFFTTKPTGQGTGLGLSLSYDIVKAHGGELRVETKQGKGTIFIITIPSG